MGTRLTHTGKILKFNPISGGGRELGALLLRPLQVLISFEPRAIVLKFCEYFHLSGIPKFYLGSFLFHCRLFDQWRQFWWRHNSYFLKLLIAFLFFIYFSWNFCQDKRYWKNPPAKNSDNYRSRNRKDLKLTSLKENHFRRQPMMLCV